MQVSKVFKSSWLIILAFFIGRINLYGINPFAIGLVVASCVLMENVMLVYLSTMIGIFTVFPVDTTVRYGILLMGLVAVLSMKSIIELKHRRTVMLFVAALFSFIINLSVSFFAPAAVELMESILETIMFISFAVIFIKGISCIKNDYAIAVVENDAAIGTLFLAAIALLGMPEIAFGSIVIRQMVALFSILFTLYKFGIGLGFAWTAIAAFIVACVNNNYIFIIAWLAVAIITYAIWDLLHWGRLLFAITFLVVYYTTGMLFFDVLICENGQKAILSAIVIFVLMPYGVMVRVDARIKNGELRESSPEWGRLVIRRINELASACKRIEYTMASDASTGIGLNDVGELIEGFANQLEQAVPLRKSIEAKIIEELQRKEIQVKNIILTKNSEDRCEVYINARVRRGGLVPCSEVVNIVSRQMKIALELKEESRRVVSKSFEMICMREKVRYKCKTAVRRLNRYDENISGDNYYIGDILDGNKLIIIADGMGSGKRADEDSNQLIEALEELLSAGFDRDMSIKLINSYLAEQNKGEHFSTLDMLLLDLHTACGRIYKQGAATTFIKRGEWIEMIKSTSLPVGVIDGAVCEKCVKKFYENDVIIMVSDGVLDSIIVENKDDYITEFLQSNQYLEPDEIAEELMGNIMAMSGNRLKDDATVVVSKLIKA